MKRVKKKKALLCWKKTNQKISFIKNKIKDKSVNFGFKSWVTLAYPYLLVMVILIVLPLLIVILYSIIKATNNAWIFRFTFSNFNDFFKENSYVMVLLRSIGYSFVATLIAVIFGYPIAYIMAFMSTKIASKNIWVLVTLPIWINILLRTIGLQIIFSILGPNVLLGTPIGIILAMVYMFMSFVILPIYNSLEKTDRNLLEASQDLGASKMKTFWKVTFRFSVPGIVSGFTLMMLSAMTSLVVVKYIGEGKTILIANIIESYFYRGANFAYGAAISVILGIIVLIIIFTLKAIGSWATGKKIGGIN
ncbi:spermidine/putrescine ABC transporter permease [Spiroplasma endosymbiont of Villa modesta]|uniref:spermidine/putrescine ABC transporter permease n=1 Tax=Spiroplasma endosymbiont of Villa modesta TaxID=3066293 RepID=UPI00313C2D67